MFYVAFAVAVVLAGLAGWYVLPPVEDRFGSVWAVAAWLAVTAALTAGVFLVGGVW